MTPENRRASIEDGYRPVQGWGTALADFGMPQVPALLMVGRNAPAMSCDMAGLLANVLPRLQLRVLEGLGHMGPTTHLEVVNAAIEDFLMRELMS